MFSFRWKLFINTRKLSRIECLSHNNTYFSDIWRFLLKFWLIVSFLHFLPDLSLLLFCSFERGVLIVPCIHCVSKDDLNFWFSYLHFPNPGIIGVSFPRNVTVYAMLVLHSGYPLIKSKPHPSNCFCCPYVKSEEHIENVGLDIFGYSLI